MKTENWLSYSTRILPGTDLFEQSLFPALRSRFFWINIRNTDTYIFTLLNIYAFFQEDIPPFYSIVAFIALKRLKRQNSKSLFLLGKGATCLP